MRLGRYVTAVTARFYFKKGKSSKERFPAKIIRKWNSSKSFHKKEHSPRRICTSTWHVHLSLQSAAHRGESLHAARAGNSPGNGPQRPPGGAGVPGRSDCRSVFWGQQGGDPFGLSGQTQRQLRLTVGLNQGSLHCWSVLGNALSIRENWRIQVSGNWSTWRQVTKGAHPRLLHSEFCTAWNCK